VRQRRPNRRPNTPPGGAAWTRQCRGESLFSGVDRVSDGPRECLYLPDPNREDLSAVRNSR